MGERIVTVGDLRKMMAEYPDDAQILHEVVAQDGTGGRLWLSAVHGRDCHFRWTPQPLILTATHPELTTFPHPPTTTERGE